jgi:hypothetical protein
MKVIPYVLTIALAVAASVVSAQQIHATVDGTAVEFAGVQPTMVDGRISVPLREIFQRMGAQVHWNSATSTVTADRTGTNVQLRIGEYTAQVDGRTVNLDSPATLVSGHVMVPIRFVSEALGARVNWHEQTQTVAIYTSATAIAKVDPSFDSYAGNGSAAGPAILSNETVGMTTIVAGTVIPFALVDELSSDNSRIGDKFTATLKENSGLGYLGLPAGTIVEGHVNAANAKKNNMPGVLGLAFDRIRLPSGATFAVQGSLIGLDSKSVDNQNGRLVAKQSAKTDLKYVGIGAGGGMVLALITKGNVLTTSVIGAALGYLYTLVQKDPAQANNVTLPPGAEFGVRLDQSILLRNASLRAEGISDGGIGASGAVYAVNAPFAGMSGGETISIDAGTVIPFKMTNKLTSNGSRKGQKFTGTMQTDGGGDYGGLPSGTIVEGHVNVVRAKTTKAPGVLGLAFDRMRLPNGQTYAIHGSLIGLDGKSVDNQDGRLVAKAGSKNDLKYVGYGAGAGALVALVTKGNLLTNSVIGAALGYGYSRLQKSPSKFNNVTLKPGTKFGVRLDRAMSFRSASVPAVSVGVQ